MGSFSKIIICLGVVLIPLSQAAVISAYNSNCAKCVENGYNYCSDDNKCVDNRPNFCYKLVDMPFLCLSSTCSPIVI